MIDPVIISRGTLATHMFFETQLPPELTARIIGVFTQYWHRRINLVELQEALRCVGYNRGLTEDSFYQWLNPEDLH